VCNWLLAARGEDAFLTAPNHCRAQFNYEFWPGPLRAMSQTLFGLGPLRTGDWHIMRNQLFEVLDMHGQDILMEAEATCHDFNMFFDLFARGQHIPPAKAQEAVG